MILLILSTLVFVGADKLDRTYLPPPGSKFSGGSPDSILPPIELPNEPSYSATTLRPQTQDFESSNPPGYFGTRQPDVSTGISSYTTKEPLGFQNNNQLVSVAPDSINRFDPKKHTKYITTQSAGTSIKPSQFHKGYTLPTTTTSYAFTQTTTYPPIAEENCSETTCTYEQDGFIDSGIEPDISVSHQSPDKFTKVLENGKKLNEKGISKPVQVDYQVRPNLVTQERQPINPSLSEFQQNEIRYPINVDLEEKYKNQNRVIQTINEKGRPVFTTSSEIPIQTGSEVSDTTYTNLGNTQNQLNQQRQPILAGTKLPTSLFHKSTFQQPMDQQKTQFGFSQSMTNILPQETFQVGSQNLPVFNQIDDTSVDEQRPSYPIPADVLNTAHDVSRPAGLPANSYKFSQTTEKQSQHANIPNEYIGNYDSKENLNQIYPDVGSSQSVTSSQAMQHAINKEGRPIPSRTPDININEVNFLDKTKAAGRPQDNSDINAIILNYKNIITPEGEFEYSYDTSNGIHADENGTAIDGVRAQGAYSYIGDDGKNYSIVYTADENGFLPRGDHLPTPPPIPEAILKLIEKANEEEAAGVMDDGSYDEEKYGFKQYQGIMDHMPHGLYSSVYNNNQFKNNDVKQDKVQDVFDNLNGRKPSYDTREGTSSLNTLSEGKDQSNVLNGKNENYSDNLDREPEISIHTSGEMANPNGQTISLVNLPNNREAILEINQAIKPSRNHPIIIDNNKKGYNNNVLSNNQRTLNTDRPNDELEDTDSDEQNKQVHTESIKNTNRNKVQKHNQLPSTKLSSNLQTNQRLPLSQDQIDTNGVKANLIPNYKTTQGPQYLPTKTEDNVVNEKEQYENQELNNDEIKMNTSNIDKNDSENIQQANKYKAVPNRNRNKVYTNLNKNAQKNSISTSDENLQLKNTAYLDSQKNNNNNAPENNGEIFDNNEFNNRRPFTLKPVFSSQSTQTTLTPEYDNSVQASTSRPSLVYKSNNNNVSDGYQYNPPKKQLLQSGSNPSLRPFSTESESTESIFNTLRPEINSKYGPTKMRNQGTISDFTSANGVPHTKQSIFDQTYDRSDQHETRTTQRPFFSQQGSSKTGTYYPNTLAPVTISTTSNYESTPISKYLPQKEYFPSSNQEYSQRHENNFVTGNKLQNTLPDTTSTFQLNRHRPNVPSQSNAFSSTTSLPYYFENGSTSVFPGPTSSDERYYSNAPNVVLPDLTQSQGPNNIRGDIPYTTTSRPGQYSKINGRPISTSTFPGRITTSPDLSQSQGPNNIHDKFQYSTTLRPDQYGNINGRPASTSTFPGRITTSPDLSQPQRPNNIHDYTQYSTTFRPDQYSKINGQPISTSTFPGRIPTSPDLSQSQGSNNIHDDFQYSTTSRPDQYGNINGRPVSTSTFPGRIPTSPDLSLTQGPNNIHEDVQYSTTLRPDQYGKTNERPISTSTFSGRIPTSESYFKPTSSVYPTNTLRPIHTQDHSPNSQYTTSIPNYSLPNKPATFERRPTAETLSTQPSIINNGRQSFSKVGSINKSYIPSTDTTAAFKTVGLNGRPVTDAYGRPISTQETIKGEDFSGPKQPQRFDQETGYHY